MKKIYIIFVIIFVLIFSIFYYKKSKLGNTIINLSKEKNIENILSNNLKYDAKLKVKIYSNKNENEYNLKIKEDGKYSLLEVTGNKDISGLRIEKKQGDLIVKDSKLKLEKIYEDYKEFTDNSLLLSSFAKEYQETKDRKEEENDSEFVIKITLKNYNRYIKYKELYIDKQNGLPKRLIIKDSSKQVKISIEYTNIEIL